MFSESKPSPAMIRKLPKEADSSLTREVLEDMNTLSKIVFFSLKIGCHR